MTEHEHTFWDWFRLVGSIACALYFAIAAYGRYRIMFPRP